MQDDWCGQDISDLLHKHVCACLKRKGVVYLRLSSGLDDGYGPIRRAYARAGFKLALPSISYYQKINHFTLEPPGRLLIARAEKKHLAAACAITSLAWSGIYAEYANLLGPDLHDRFFAGWEAKKHQAVSQELSGPRAYVAVLEDKLVGFISYTLVEAGSYAVIGHNAVHSSWRGQGIGGQLYKHVLNCMLKEGVAYAKVTTGLDVAHAPARRAYAKAGFLHGLSSCTYLRKLEC